MILRELRLMNKQPAYRFILLCVLALFFVGLCATALFAGGIVTLHRLGLF